MKIAVLTGASAGLGVEFLKSLSVREPDLDEIWMIARRKEKMEEIVTRLGLKNARIISLDLTQKSAYEEYRALLTKENPEIKVLINNAGSGRLGNVIDESTEDQLRQTDLNVSALTALTNISLRFMKKGSYIVNVCSIAAFAPNPRMTVYCSTKAYVLSYSKSLRFELKKSHGINVLAVCPGPMRTEFLGVAGITDENSKTFATLPYCNPEKVADGAIVHAQKGHGIYTPRLFFKFYRFLAKILPHSLVMYMSKA